MVFPIKGNHTALRRQDLSKPFISLFIQNFFIFCSFSVMNVLPDHLAGLGASKTLVGLFMNVNSLALVLLVVPLSRYADRLGRKSLMMWAYSSALSTAALSFVFADSLAALMVLRILGVGLYCVVYTLQASEAFGLFPREYRVSGMAVFGISGIVSNPIGAFIGERLLEGPGARWLFVAIFGLTAVALLFAIPFRFTAAPEGERKAPLLELMRRKELVPLFTLAFMLGGVFAVFSSFLANMTRERLGTVNISIFFLAFSFVAVFMRIFLGSWLERLQPRYLASACFVLLAVALILTFRLAHAAMLIPIGLVFGTGRAVLYPLLSTLFVNTGSDADRLGLNNLYSTANTLGSIISAVAMGVVADLFGLSVVFLVMAVLTAVMLPVGYLGLRGHSVRGL